MIETIVCTMSREGTPEMNDMINQSLNFLGNTNYPLVGIHLGERDSDISSRMRECYTDLIIEQSPREKNPLRRAKLTSQKLLGGLKESIESASKLNPASILYTEADKFNFIQFIPRVIEPIISGRADLTIAVRSSKGFARFPLVQRIAEKIANDEVCRITGIQADYMYGPRAFNVKSAAAFANYPRNDWGILTYAVVDPILRGQRMEKVEVEGMPQPGYMKKYDLIMRFPLAHVAWRIIQNLPHIKAANLASKKYKKSD